MLRVALTGGIGSGKSTAAAMFRDLGCFVSQSDEVARVMMQPGQAVYDSIVHSFGPGVVRPDGSLDRRALARLAFHDGRAEELNAIVHPAVIAAQAAWMRQMAEQHPGAVAMIESALVFETRHGSSAADVATPFNEAAPGARGSWRSRFDRIVLVTAPEPIRLQRSVDRYLAHADASSTSGRADVEADARLRMRAQMPDEEKAALADAVIRNDSSVDDLRARVIDVWQQILAWAHNQGVPADPPATLREAERAGTASVQGPGNGAQGRVSQT